MKVENVYKESQFPGLRHSACIVRTANGDYVAMVGDNGFTNQRRANSAQAAAVFRKAFAVSQLKAGDEVIGWDHNGAIEGTYLGRVGDEHEILDTNTQQKVTIWYVLPFALARKEPFLRSWKQCRLEEAVFSAVNMLIDTAAERQLRQLWAPLDSLKCSLRRPMDTADIVQAVKRICALRDAAERARASAEKSFHLHIKDAMREVVRLANGMLRMIDTAHWQNEESCAA